VLLSTRSHTRDGFMCGIFTKHISKVFWCDFLGPEKGQRMYETESRWYDVEDVYEPAWRIITLRLKVP